MNQSLHAELKNYPTAMNVPEVAEVLRLCTKSVYKLIKSGEIPVLMIGKSYRIAKKDVYIYLSRKQTLNPDCVVSDNSCGKVWTCARS